MNKTSLRKSALHPGSPSRRLPPTQERTAQDEMLFGDADGSPDELDESAEPDDRQDYTHIDQENNEQPSTINYVQDFTAELKQAAQHASQAQVVEDYEEVPGGMALVKKSSQDFS